MFSAYSPAYGSGYWGRGRVHIATAASLDGRSGRIPATSVDHIIDGEAEVIETDPEKQIPPSRD